MTAPVQNKGDRCGGEKGKRHVSRAGPRFAGPRSKKQQQTLPRRWPQPGAASSQFCSTCIQRAGTTTPAAPAFPLLHCLRCNCSATYLPELWERPKHAGQCSALAHIPQLKGAMDGAVQRLALTRIIEVVLRGWGWCRRVCGFGRGGTPTQSKVTRPNTVHMVLGEDCAKDTLLHMQYMMHAMLWAGSRGGTTRRHGCRRP
jgi:hypothetical protein